MSYQLKKEFADARISVGKFKIDITKDNVNEEFTQKVIAQTPSIQHMFDEKNKSVSSQGEKHEV